MWTSENCHRYDRDKLRYPRDLTDAEWQLVKPLIPPAKRGGGKRTVNIREVVNGVMYVLSTGCQWRYIPKDLPPRSTVNGYFCQWGWDGTLQKIHHTLYVKCRDQAVHAPKRVFTTCFGPRTAAAGFIGSTWPVISQSNSMRTAASCCFTPGAPCFSCSSFTQAATPYFARVGSKRGLVR